MSVSLDINDEEPRWGDLDPLARSALDATLAHLGYDPACFEVSLLACNDARIQALNGQFRAKDKPTNVLSWPAWDLSPETPGGAPDAPETGTPDDPEPLGDIALAYETCAREAEEQGKRFADHVSHLIVHSTLHLLGFDHETDEDALLMEKTEVLVLAQMGIADPYADDHDATPVGVTALD